MFVQYFAVVWFTHASVVSLFSARDQHLNCVGGGVAGDGARVDSIVCIVYCVGRIGGNSGIPPIELLTSSQNCYKFWVVTARPPTLYNELFHALG